MNLSQHTELWKKIQAFSLDEPGAVITFSSKLSSQQQWSLAYTQRVIEEYRRFIFLCAIHPKGASPSKAVDEAWHLHLTYTHSYWIKLCREILGKDIHHIPSTGGDTENHKHDDWYKETLAFYRTVFGTYAPADIWPVLSKDKAQEIPEPVFTLKPGAIVTTVFLMIIPFVIITSYDRQPNPFTLTGPQFLFFYLLLIIATLSAFVLQQWARTRQLVSAAGISFPANTNAFEAAQFLYGKDRAVQACIVDLVQRKMLEVKDGGQFIIRKNQYRATPLEKNPFVDDLLKQEEGAIISYEMIAAGWYSAAELNTPFYDRLWQFANRSESFLKKYFIVLVAVVIGVARVMQGISNQRPVLFLLVEIAILIVVARWLGKHYSRRHLVIDRMQQLCNDMLKNYTGDERVVPSFVVSGNPAYGGFAEGAVLATMFLTIAPPVNRPFGDRFGDAGSSWSSCGSSGGDSSCSSGSSCGSGGCGGCGGGGD